MFGVLRESLRAKETRTIEKERERETRFLPDTAENSGDEDKQRTEEKPRQKEGACCDSGEDLLAFMKSYERKSERRNRGTKQKRMSPSTSSATYRDLCSRKGDTCHSRYQHLAASTLLSLTDRAEGVRCLLRLIVSKRSQGLRKDRAKRGKRNCCGQWRKAAEQKDHRKNHEALKGRVLEERG